MHACRAVPAELLELPEKLCVVLRLLFLRHLTAAPSSVTVEICDLRLLPSSDLYRCTPDIRVSIASGSSPYIPDVYWGHYQSFQRGSVEHGLTALCVQHLPSARSKMKSQRARRSQAAVDNHEAAVDNNQAGNSGLDGDEMRLRTHAFVQGLLQRSCLKEAKAKLLFTRLTNDTSGDRTPAISFDLRICRAGRLATEDSGRSCWPFQLGLTVWPCRGWILTNGGSGQRHLGVSAAGPQTTQVLGDLSWCPALGSLYPPVVLYQ